MCYDGSSATGAYELATSCDLILLDLNLPDIDGIEILRHLRSYDNETGSADPVCKEPDQPTRSRDWMSGASDYLVKPFHLDETQSTYTKSDKTQIHTE